MSAGYEHIDVKACIERGIHVGHLTSQVTEATVRYFVRALVHAFIIDMFVPTLRPTQRWRYCLQQLAAFPRLLQYKRGLEFALCRSNQNTHSSSLLQR